MSLSPGTALQNGHYVIDALLEEAPNGDLYWGTHVVTGMQVFIQVFPICVDNNSDDLSNLIARLEGVAFSPNSPLPNPFQLFHGEDSTLCLAMGITVGLPWSLACGTHPPMTPKLALKTVRHMADSVVWLKEKGIVGLDLSPNRVWLSETHDRILFTGLPQNSLNGTEETNEQPDTSVEFLSRLLYSFLTGELPTSTTAADLRTALNHQLPTLSPLIVQAIIQGYRPNDVAHALTLQEWLDQLPDAVDAYPKRSANTSLVLRQSSARVEAGTYRWKVFSALAGTASLAAIVGLALGTFWRLNAKSMPGAIQFDPDQAFPSQAEWSGDLPKASFETPFVPAPINPVRREDWVDSDWDTTPEVDTWAVPSEATEWPEEPEDFYDPAFEAAENDREELPIESPMENVITPAEAPVIDDLEDSDLESNDEETPEPSLDREAPKDFSSPGELPQDIFAPLMESPPDRNSTDVSDTAGGILPEQLEIDSKAVSRPSTTSES